MNLFTVNVPFDVPGGHFECVIDLFQDSLKLLLLGNLGLRDLSDIKLLSLQLL